MQPKDRGCGVGIISIDFKEITYLIQHDIFRMIVLDIIDSLGGIFVQFLLPCFCFLGSLQLRFFFCFWPWLVQQEDTKFYT